MNTDHRYDYATCPGCGQRFQLIDWRCAVHQIYHPGDVIPEPGVACSPIDIYPPDAGAVVDEEAS